MSNYLATLGILLLYGIGIFTLAMLWKSKSTEATQAPPDDGGKRKDGSDTIESFAEFSAGLRHRPIASEQPLVNAERRA